MDDLTGRVLVTGGSGFIGSFLVEALVRRGAEVHCLYFRDNPARHLGSIKAGVRLHRADVCFHRADISDWAQVRDVVSAVQPEVVFHLAAAGVTDVYVDPALATRVNVEGTLNLLGALDGRYRVFVNAGTCHEYGNHGSLLSEELDPRPESAYAITKAAVWHFCNRFYRTNGWPIVTVRPFASYGPRQTPNTFIQACVRAARTGTDFEMTPGEQLRDFVYVTDVVEGLIRAASVPAAIGGTFNLCSGQGIPLYRVAEMIVAEVGRPIAIKRGARPYRDGEIWQLVGDNTRARTILGWSPRLTLEQGIRETIAAWSA